MVRVKICGLTNPEDAQAAIRWGADALGFILAESPRRVEPDTIRDIIRRLPPFVVTVGVFVNADLDDIRAVRDYCGLDAVQLHGDQSPEFLRALGGRVVKVLRVGPDRPLDPAAYPQATLLLDTYSPEAHGGTGRTFDWRLAVDAARQRPIILAGGLSPANVARAIETVKPYAVDVSSGVEKDKGRKDHDQMALFIARAKGIAR